MMMNDWNGYAEIMSVKDPMIPAAGCYLSNSKSEQHEYVSIVSSNFTEESLKHMHQCKIGGDFESVSTSLVRIVYNLSCTFIAFCLISISFS